MFKTKTIQIILQALFITLIFGFLQGCAYEKIKPWHRDVLAKEMAQLVPDALENESDEHIYFSKEAAKGGQGVGGGGCGCN